MKRIKEQAFLILSLTLLILAFSQLAEAQSKDGRATKSPPQGEIKGTIYIKGVSGNNSQQLTCSNFQVFMHRYDGKTAGRFQHATGDFSTRQCSYSIRYLQAETDYKPSIKAVRYATNPVGVAPREYQTCDQTSMEAYDAQVILRVKADKTHTFNFSVKKIICTVVK